MAITMSRDELPEVGDVVSKVKIGDDRVADVYFESGRRVPVHLSPEDRGHKSDCALHNGPALPVEPCDCGQRQNELTANCEES